MSVLLAALDLGWLRVAAVFSDLGSEVEAAMLRGLIFLRLVASIAKRGNGVLK